MIKDNFKINDRLFNVASFVEEGRKVIDVGCDHALLSIYLVQNKKPFKVIASDIKEGPLVHANENIKKYKVQDKIIVKLGSGIEPIEEDIDTIIISGMGGLNMIGILKYCPDKYKNVDTIILSPNSDTNVVRKEICKLGFYIEDEMLVKEKEIVYPIICFKRGKKKYSYKDYLYGPILIKKRDVLFLEYMKKEKQTKEKLLEVMPKKYFEKRWQLKKELKVINEIL